MAAEPAIVIAGIGQTAFGKLPGRSVISLSVEAARNALDDAAVEKNLVDAVLTKSITSGHPNMFGQAIAEALGLQPRLGGLWDQGGASNITLVAMAAEAIRSGACEVALVLCADNPRAGSRHAYSRARAPRHSRYGWVGNAGGYAMITQRHMQEFGTTSAQLAEVAVACRRHGAANPYAQLRVPITVADHQESPWVVEPLRRDDCCLVSDGAAAVVVMSEARARALGVAAPVRLVGFGHGQTSWSVELRPELTSTMASVAATRLWATTGLTPADIDVAQLYDCFTITVLMALEEYGFCRRGQGGRALAEGLVDRERGGLAVNTSGGLLSETGMPGMQLVLEGVRQIRGTSVNQVPDARHCLVTNQGGIMHTHAAMVLGS